LVATRSIVTSQPDVACDVCARRLLRGEQSEVFLAAGRRRTVCELCAPRALHEGWLRETDHDPVSLPVEPARRGRSLFDRLRQVGKPTAGAASTMSSSDESEPAPYDFLDGSGRVAEESYGRQLSEESEIAPPPARAQPVAAVAAVAGRGGAEHAIAVFNASEHPRRVSGVARSLGAPSVNVRPDEDVEDLVLIVIAWELCWYRYEVRLYDGDAAVRVLAQGTELGELANEDRLANAVAEESGALALSPGRGV
jgi:hypothetical protein